MTVKNIKNHFKINIVSKRGKPIITKGFVAIHAGCDSISEEVLYKDFVWEGK